MVIKSYNEIYLSTVAENLGVMLEHAVDIGKNPVAMWNIFVCSNVAKQIEKGNPKYLNCSALDYLSEILENNNLELKQDINKDKYYWAGWVLAQYQYKTGKSFYKINTILPIQDVLNLYPTLHEADVTKFFDIANEYFKNTSKEINLKIIRTSAGLSQSELSKMAEVDLRSIQMYEQRKNDINKAQAETLHKLALVLGCNIEDLLDL